MARWPVDPVVRRALTEENHVRAEYAKIRVPVLAIYRTSETMEQVLTDHPPRNAEERSHARIVELPGANLFMFLSHEADVIREITAFAATLE
jgi:pimeloyl-ACP methyl ester carboxylesterase